MLSNATAKPSHTAIAEFTTPERRTEAQKRLARVRIADHQLHVEALEASDPTKTTPTHEHSTAKPPAVREEAQTTGKSRRHHTGPQVPTPLAPHLGLHYAPSPLLQYKYPRASVPVVRNIANALMALPRFYTQVLHLMNKMNLPTPFEPDAIPGAFSEAVMPDIQSVVVAQKKKSQDDAVEEEDDDDEPGRRREDATKKRRGDQNHCLDAVKKPRVCSNVGMRDDEEMPRTGIISAAQLKQQRLPRNEWIRNPAFSGYSVGERSLRVRVRNVAETTEISDLRFVFGIVLPGTSPLNALEIELDPRTATALVTYPSLEASTRAVEQLNGVVLDGRALVVTFDCVESSAPEQTADATASSLAGEPSSSQPAGLPSAQQWTRMDATELAMEKAMKNYHRGDPSSALYVKNLAKAVDEAVLRSLCASSLPPEVDAKSLSIRHFAEGRMKNQAFIEFPSVDAAERVLDAIHGLNVHDKPLVVSFRKTQPVASR